MSNSVQLTDSNELPPPYTPTSSDPPTLDPTIFSSSLSSHLSSLPFRIRSTASANNTRRTAADLSTISLLLPHIEAFLSAAAQRAAASPPSSSHINSAFDEHAAKKPLVAELTLVPAAAVPPRAERGDVRERRREGEFLRIVRVAPPPSKGATGDRKQGAARATDYRQASTSELSSSLRAWDPDRDERFDAWGRFGDDAMTAETRSSYDDDNDDDDGFGSRNQAASAEDPAMHFWASEATARRLACYLQPSSATQETKPMSNLTRMAVQKAVQEEREKEKEKRSWFGRSKAKVPEEAPKTRAEDVVVVEQAGRARTKADENVVMTVKAEELSFQTENELGLYESVKGWGIVVRVRIRRA